MAEIDAFTTRARDYKDISLTFGRNPVTNDILSVTGADAVKRSLKTLIMTMTGEAPFFPEFGSRLSRLLFEPIDPITTALIDSELRATINGYEPRVTIRSLTITPSVDEHAYNIELTFQLVNQVEPITLTLFLTRLR